MKINKVTTRIVKTPGDSPLVFDQAPATSTFDFVTLELGTDQGLVGIGGHVLRRGAARGR